MMPRPWGFEILNPVEPLTLQGDIHDWELSFRHLETCSSSPEHYVIQV